MNKKYLAITAIIAITVLSGCTRLVPPSDTMQEPKAQQQETVDKSKEITDQFLQLKAQNKTPAELMAFIEPEIGNLNKEDADSVLKGLLEIQELQLKNYTDKIMSESFNSRMNSYKYEDLLHLKDIKDADIKELLQKAYENGFKLHTSEGMYDLELDYNSINKKFAPYISEDIAAYLSIMSKQSEKHFAEDAALTVGLDELAGRVVETEDFINKYSTNTYIDKVKELDKYYLTAYLLGLNNTPAFSYDDNKLKQEFLDSYTDSMNKYKDSKLAEILKNYTDLLSKNGNKRTSEILDFVNKTVGK